MAIACVDFFCSFSSECIILTHVSASREVHDLCLSRIFSGRSEHAVFLQGSLEWYSML